MALRRGTRQPRATPRPAPSAIPQAAGGCSRAIRPTGRAAGVPSSLKKHGEPTRGQGWGGGPRGQGPPLPMVPAWLWLVRRLLRHHLGSTGGPPRHWLGRATPRPQWETARGQADCRHLTGPTLRWDTGYNTESWGPRSHGLGDTRLHVAQATRSHVQERESRWLRARRLLGCRPL